MATPSGDSSDEDLPLPPIRYRLPRQLEELPRIEELRLEREYSEALKLGEVLVTYGRVMMIGAGGSGKTSLRHGLMKIPLPKMASSTLLANALSVKCQWAGAGDSSGKGWMEIDEEDEINELAALLCTILKNKSLLQSVDSASAIKEFQPVSQSRSEGSGLVSQQPESTNIGSNLPDMVQKIEEEVFRKARLATLHHQMQSEVLLNLWDSGGQVVFMNVLPAFLTKRTLFMLVFDASKNLETKLQVATLRTGKVVHTENYHLNTTELLLQWMASIDAHLSHSRKVGAKVEPYPKVMLIGTHLDQLALIRRNRAAASQRIFDFLRSQYKKKRYADLLMPSPEYIVDNTTAGQEGKEDPAFKEIRKCVHEFAADNLSVHTPITWVLFRKVMQTISQANKPVMKYSEAIAVAEACSIPPSALSSVLNFYHELGVFLYYSKIPSLKESIIATPQWLINHIAQLLRPCGLEDRGREHQWTLFREKGILTETLYKGILKHSMLDPQALVDLLEHFLLAAPIKTTHIHHYEGKEYFVPCMLHAPTTSRWNAMKQIFSKHLTRTVLEAKPIHLIFNTGYVPPGFYVRLLASVAKSSHCRILFEQINRYTVTFAYKVLDFITVREHTDSIEVLVTRSAQEGSHVPPLSEVCRETFELINASVEEVYTWLPGVSVTTAFVCSNCSSKVPRHFIIFGQDNLTALCQMEKVQHLGQFPSQQFWLKPQETTPSPSGIEPQSIQFAAKPHQQQPYPQQQPWDGHEAELTTSNWQYQIMFKNSAAVTRALTAKGLAIRLADELRSRRLIGAAVHDKATNYGPNITEYERVRHLISALLSDIEHNSQRYHDFIEVLHLDGIYADAESALALLPTDPPLRQK